jgi:hypothetical protein
VLPPVTMVLPCSMSVEAYAAAGKEIEVPRPDCPSCSLPMAFWCWYSRSVRVCDEFLEIWIRRARCSRCEASHALLPSFLFLGRYDPAEVIGSVIEAVARRRSGVRPAAIEVRVPPTTARDWMRRFAARAAELAVAFGASAIELGGALATVTGEARADAVAAIEAAFAAASDLPGWLELGCFGFCSCVTGGRLIAPNSNPPAILLGRRRFIAPVT